MLGTWLKHSLRLNGIVGKGTAASDVVLFTDGKDDGAGERSGKRRHRRSPEACPRRWPIRLFAAFLFGFNRISRGERVDVWID